MIALIYDGDCPFCANYVALLNLRKRYPEIQLVDAREEPEHPAVAKVRAAGLKIDDGMILVEGDVIHHGGDALNALASSGSGIDRILFSSRRRSNAVYPVLRAGRNLALRLLGRRKLGF